MSIELIKELHELFFDDTVDHEQEDFDFPHIEFVEDDGYQAYIADVAQVLIGEENYKLNSEEKSSDD